MVENNNIRVAIRVRPLIAREKRNKSAILWEMKNNSIVQVSGSEPFCYDRVFGYEDDNQEVYNDLCFPIVRSVVDGFNGTIFAYGQTSSGKTFTMMGEHSGILKGLIHYTINDIFNLIQEMPDREFLLRVSFLEIYNEKVFDLLSKKYEDLKLLEDSYGYVKVNGLQEKIVQTPDQILEWMDIGQRKRRTGETEMNRVSSRSHSIFRMIVESRVRGNEDAGVNVSQLNLVDLAGSENVKQTKTKGERFKEGIHINLSLSTLSQVISQLSEKEDQFVNYRNSKLTRLLQNSLGGNALTAIICTVTPTSMRETLSTLNFASRAKKIKNKPEKNEILTDQALLKQYANKINKLAQELQASKAQGKELEEKTKQNESLKKQIETLKANFVAQIVPDRRNKAIRRETWGGRIDAKQLQSVFEKKKNRGAGDLHVLEEEAEGEDELAEFEADIAAKVRKLSAPSEKHSRLSNLVKNSKEICTQTNSDISNVIPEYDEAIKMVSELKMQLTELQNRHLELAEFTVLEQQHLKVAHEQTKEMEALRKDNSSLKEQLTNFYKSSSIPLNTSENLEKKEPLLEITNFNHEKLSKEQVNSSVQSQLNKAMYLTNNTFNDSSSIFSDKGKENTIADSPDFESIVDFDTERIVKDKEIKFKKEIKALQYDKELKDKQIDLLKDKIEIKEQMIISLQNEIILGKNSELDIIKEYDDKTYKCRNCEKKSTNVQSCQINFEALPAKDTINIECQTSPMICKYEDKNETHCFKKCIDCEKKLTDVQSRQINFEALPAKEALNIECQTSPMICNCDRLKDKSETKYFKSIENIQDFEDVKNTSRLSPLGIYLENTEVSLSYSDDDEQNFQVSQTSEIKMPQTCRIENGHRKLEDVTTTPVAHEENKNVDHRKFGLSTDEKLIQTSPISNMQICNCSLIKANPSNIVDQMRQEMYCSSNLINNPSNQSVEMKSLVNKVKELKIYVLELAESVLESEYLENDEASASCNQTCLLNDAEDHITALKHLIRKLRNCIKSQKDTLDLFKEQLEKRFEETISLDLKLTEAESSLDKKEKLFSKMSEKIFKLKDSIMHLDLISSRIKDVKSKEEFENIKQSNSSSYLKSDSSNVVLHDLKLMQDIVAQIDSNMEENALLIIGLSDKLKLAKTELTMLNREKLTNQKTAFSVSKAIQTDMTDMSTAHKTSESNITKLSLQFETEIKSLKEKNDYLEKSKEKLKEQFKEREETLILDFERANSDWEKKTRILVQDLEAKYEKELTDQEDKLTEKLIEMKQNIKERSRKDQELREAALKVKSLQDEVITKNKLQNEISELADKFAKEQAEKNNLMCEIEKKERERLALNVKMVEMRSSYTRKMAKCDDLLFTYEMEKKGYIEQINDLEVELKELKEKGDFRLKKSVQCSSNRNENKLFQERDSLLAKYEKAKQQIYNLNQEIKQAKLENGNKQYSVETAASKEFEETKQHLLYEIDQKKAKIMSLEANNSSLLKEMKKLKEMLSLKSDTCNCKVKSRSDIPVSHGPSNGKSYKNKFADKTSPEINQTQKFVGQDDENQHSASNSEVKDSDPDALCVGGGSGPANMVKCYWLEGVIRKKDKEINEYRKKMRELESELKTLKMCPVAFERKNENPKVPKVKVPCLYEETDEDITVYNNALRPYQFGAIPKVPSKHTLKKEKLRTSAKPYESLLKTDTLRKLDADWDKMRFSSNKSTEKELSDVKVAKLITGESDCKQQ